MPTSTVEDYLKAILLQEGKSDSDLVTMGQIAAALDVAPGTVTAMVKTLASSDLVSYEPYSGVALTDAGRRLALHVLRRHRLVELFLVEVMGMSWSEVHIEAERLEHVISERLLERMDEMLGSPSVDPHGDPIPDADGVLAEPRLKSLASCGVGEGLAIARVTDQSPDFLELVEKRGFKPGARVVVVGRDEAADAVTLRLADGSVVNLGDRAAAKILVRPVERGPARTPAAGPSG
ncbi:MAG: metal-dependent transcriptional regulator [Thermoanaerobaculia bacterium]|nr:metal-dependent transcriptional regulator [Thermoanaerobaculia bacterium]